MTTVTIEYKLKPYEFQCKGCGLIHKRSLWSVAHYNEPHDFTCECGHITANVHKKEGGK